MSQNSQQLAKHPTMSDLEHYNPLNDPNLPPFSRALTWKEIGNRVSAREYWKMKIRQEPDNSRYHHHLAPL